ncbi:MAG: hypothetical protein A2161_17965 [Candidatus Schekmanbacteria bacterium RBG_13_48_7]|uniref:Tetratricopeptide repeat protein 21A/21B N-terminal ARM repeat domain-containing protein n=1 Tax=Candidatus Schekmanbacteria bacterium RBG_13_48_7 TaxID=1817878 RepID=A0A1F7RIR5_9BACT|nr:MAG: hypothetical protein A2161_17965 [Candidatus Schekmanbacteria bacterium RBG_13_48_7]
MAKKLSKKDLKVSEDEFFSTMEKIIVFGKENRNILIQSAVIVLVIAIITFAYITYRNNLNSTALSQEITAQKKYDEAVNAMLQTRQSQTEQPSDEQIKTKLNEATTEFEKVVQEYSSSSVAPEAYLYLANCYYYSGDYVKAMENFKKITANYPRHLEYVSALVGTAYCYEQQSNYKDAITTFEKILNETANTQVKVDSYLGIARNFELQDQKDKAIEIYEKIVKNFQPEYYGVDIAHGRLDDLKNPMS